MTGRPRGVPAITNRALGGYVLALGAGMAVVHGYTALLAGSRITLGTGLLLVAVALYIVLFVRRNGTALRTRAYGSYFTHASAYLVVNGSFWLHAWVLALAGRDDVVAERWAGALVPMSVLWGLGLLAHTIGAVVSSGYDDAAV